MNHTYHKRADGSWVARSLNGIVETTLPPCPGCEYDYAEKANATNETFHDPRVCIASKRAYDEGFSKGYAKAQAEEAARDLKRQMEKETAEKVYTNS